MRLSQIQLPIEDESVMTIPFWMWQTRRKFFFAGNFCFDVVLEVVGGRMEKAVETGGGEVCIEQVKYDRIHVSKQQESIK